MRDRGKGREEGRKEEREGRENEVGREEGWTEEGKENHFIVRNQGKLPLGVSI